MNSEENRKRVLEDEIDKNIDYSDKVGVTFNREFSFFMVTLPNFMVVANPPSSSQVGLDIDMQEDLVQAQVLNWCRTSDIVYPIRTKSDGNCLCHAVSTAIWGVPDDKHVLRNLILVSIDSPGRKERWRHHYENSGESGRESLFLSLNEWEREWKRVIDTVSPAATPSSTATPYAHLEAIHIFTLANILRRPIIVLADPTARTLSGISLQESDIGGIYLPLDRPPNNCHKYPIILGYTMSHFCPLLPQESAGKSTFTVPIVTQNGSSLPVKFLTSREEKNAGSLLQSYLKIKEVPLSTSDSVGLVLCTEMKSLPVPDSMNVFASITREPNLSSSQTQVLSPAGISEFASVACITPECAFYGSPATGNMCSECLAKYLYQQPRQTPRLQGHQQTPRFQVEHELQIPFPQSTSTAEPTAPPPSMPMSQEFVDLSIMGESCQAGCGFRCSTKTYPYCHECAEKLRASVRHSPTEAALFGTGNIAAHSSTGHTVVQESTGNAAAQSSASNTTPQLNIVNPTVTGSGTSILHSAGSVAAQGSTGNAEAQFTTSITNMEKVTAVLHGRCRGEECPLQGKTHLGGLCDKCYMSEQRKKKICSSPGCLGNRNESGYCFSCEKQMSAAAAAALGGDKKQHQQQEGLVEKQYESGSSEHLSSSSLIASGLKCNAEVLKPLIVHGSGDKIQCASPMCSRLIYPPNKLCDRCIDILRMNQASLNEQTPQEEQQRHLAAALEPTIVSLKDDDVVQTWPPHGRSLSSPQAVRQHMMKVQLSEKSRSNSAPIGRKCLTPGCTKFGDPSTSDLCTACYQNAHTGALNSSSLGATGPRALGRENLNPEFSAMMERVVSQKRSPRQCKAAECSNYGNPVNEGFCNSCYPRYLRMKSNL